MFVLNRSIKILDFFLYIQIVIYSKKGELRFDDLCLEGNANDIIKLQKCSPGHYKQIWNYNNDVCSNEFLFNKINFFSSRQNI